MAEPSKVMPSSRARLELGRGDGEALQRAEDVGEPEADEADPALLDGPQDVVELLLHASSLRTAAVRIPEAGSAQKHSVHVRAIGGEIAGR